LESDNVADTVAEVMLLLTTGSLEVLGATVGPVVDVEAVGEIAVVACKEAISQQIYRLRVLRLTATGLGESFELFLLAITPPMLPPMIAATAKAVTTAMTIMRVFLLRPHVLRLCLCSGMSCLFQSFSPAPYMLSSPPPSAPPLVLSLLVLFGFA
jgi:hypothetical protein